MLQKRNFTKRIPPALPYSALAAEILGPAYEVSMVFAGNSRMRTLNQKYRGKNYPANVLAFGLGPLDGEIFLNLEMCPPPELGKKLVIHALCHLKGLRHGSIMEAHEARLYHHWNRRGHLRNSRSSRHD